MPKRAEHHECEECPEWIFTFADLVMLMMGFFVILWVLKPVMEGATAEAGSEKREQWEETVAAIRESFQYVPSPDSDDPIDQLILSRRHAGRGPAKGKETLEPREGLAGTDARNTMVRLSPQSAVGGSIVFPAGSHRLSTDERSAVEQIATAVRGYRFIVLVKAHATPDETTPGDPDGLELSMRRAQAVRDALVAQGVARDTLRLLAAGTFEPLTKWTGSQDDYQRNRRVEVEVTRQTVRDFQD